LRSKIYTDDSAFFPDFVSSQNDIDPATATEIHDNIPRLKVRKTGWVATSPGEIERCLRSQGKLFFAIKPLTNCIA
jgi:hypothetical protein